MSHSFLAGLRNSYKVYKYSIVSLLLFGQYSFQLYNDLHKWPHRGLFFQGNEQYQMS